MIAMFGHVARRLSVASACLTFMIVAPPAKPAIACSCFGDAIQTAEAVGPPDVVFTGRVVDRGPSDVTEGFVVGEPGVAYLFEVETVRVGVVGASVVLHAPDGDGAGNCSIPEPVGQQFVAARRDESGFLRGGLCSIFPVSRAPQSTDLTLAFGPEQPPDPSVVAEVLDPLDDTIDAAEEGLEPEPSQVFEDPESSGGGGLSLIFATSLVGVTGLAMLGGRYWQRRSA